MKVGIFGAQGNFGSKLYSRLQEIKPTFVELLPTKDRNHNQEIAALVDLAVVVVQPQNANSLLREITSVLKTTARILSFVGQYPLKSVEKITNRPAVRGIADPWWNLSAFVIKDNFPKKGLDLIFKNLTKETFFLKDDESISHFTKIISYLFVVLILQQAQQEKYLRKHLNFIANQLNLPLEKLKSMTPREDLKEAQSVITTRGGVSEKILSLLRHNPEIEPHKLLAKL